MTTQDELIAQSEEAELDAERSARAANLFDVRRFIGGLFVIYGVILFILGLGASDAEVQKAAGVNVNLWTGLAMLVVGGIFIAWALLRPLAEELREEQQEEEATAARTPVAVGADGAATSGSEEASRRSRFDRDRG